MKRITTVSIDIDLCEKAKKKRINISSLLNNALREKVGLRPKKALEELRLEKELELAKGLKLDPEVLLFIKDTLDRETVNTWRTFKEKFRPEYNVFKFVKIRSKIEKALQEIEEELKDMKNHDPSTEGISKTIKETHKET